MPKAKEVLHAIESQRARTQRQVRKKAQQVTSLTSKEEDDEEEEIEVQSPVKITIMVGDKQILEGSTIGSEPKKNIRFKFTTKRPQEEELAQIKGEIIAKQPPKRVCIREVEQTEDSYLKLVKLHKERKQVVEEEEKEEEESPLHKEL